MGKETWGDLEGVVGVTVNVNMIKYTEYTYEIFFKIYFILKYVAERGIYV